MIHRGPAVPWVGGQGQEKLERTNFVAGHKYREFVGLGEL